MKTTIIAIGHIKQNHEEYSHAQKYLKIMPNLEMIEIEERSGKEAAEVKAAQYEKIVTKIPKNAFLIIMDERGQNLTSHEFAHKLEQAARPICFVIGGAFGIDDRLKAKADMMLSLGKLTMAHKLARVVLLEQVYRAGTILSGHPYHKN